MISIHSAGAPELDVDLFADASLRDPFKDYQAIRDAGPAVRLRRPDVYALGRFADVQAALRAPERLISGEGVGFSDVFNASRGMNVLQSDGDLHARMRATVMRPLAPSKIRQARADLRRLVARRIGALVGAGPFNAMKVLAAFLPIEAVSHLVGLPEVGRERMLDWAAAAFNVIGPDQDGADLAVLAEARTFITGLSAATVRSGSWAGDLFLAAESGRLSMTEAMAALSAYVIPSLDTTILATGHLLHDLASHPEQWARLRKAPEKIPAAVLESVRRDAVIRWFSRVAVEDYDVDGVVVPRGARVMLMYGSANRDERRYADPDRFDIDRDARDQLCWGAGAHMCAGMHLARLEMEVMLEALVEADVSLAPGAPVMGANRGLFGYVDLPLRITSSTARDHTMGVGPRVPAKYFGGRKMSLDKYESSDPAAVTPESPPFIQAGPIKLPLPGSLPPLANKVDYEALRQRRMAEVDEETHHINLPFGTLPPGVAFAPPPAPHVLAPGLKAWNVEIPGPAGPLAARIYMPEQRDGPIGMYFHTHGGGWCGFDGLDACDTENSSYAQGFGSAVIQVDHRVSWQAKFPSQVEDSFATYKWILEHADELGVDRTKIGIGGGCTGANIATVVSLMARDAGIQKPAVQWLWTPVFDTRNDTRSYEEFANYSLTQATAEAVTRLYLRSKEDTFDWRASPLLVPSVEGLSPAIIWAGEWEVLRDESRQFATRLREAGVDVTYIEGPKQPHAGIYAFNRTTGEPTRYSRETVPKINALMQRYIGPDA